MPTGTTGWSQWSWPVIQAYGSAEPLSVWPDWKTVGDVESFWRAERRFEPKMPAPTRERVFGEWKAAVARVRG